MGKLDARNLRYLSNDEFRVLVAVEMGMKNHELVPTPLIEKIAMLRHGGTKKMLQNLLKFKLLRHDAKKYDGYHLTYLGYDYLALKTFVKRGLIHGVGRQIGVGKESDIFIVVNEREEEMVLKLQRLGRTSFRKIKQKRDYLKHRSASNWLYVSRLGALKEYAFMKALHENGFPVPTPIDWNRHCVIMSKVEGHLLNNISKMNNPDKVMKQCLDIIVKLAEYGLIHGDFNEFNLMVSDDEKVTVIDFPQMVSTSHKNAEMLFDRDVNCIIDFFNKRFGVQSDYIPKLEGIKNEHNLDVAVEASGFTKKMEKQMEEYLEQVQDKDESSEEEEENEEGNEEQENNLDEINNTDQKIIENEKTESNDEKKDQQQQTNDSQKESKPSNEQSKKSDVEILELHEDVKNEEVDDDEVLSTVSSHRIKTYSEAEIKRKVKQKLQKQKLRKIMIKKAKKQAAKGRKKLLQDWDIH